MKYLIHFSLPIEHDDVTSAQSIDRTHTNVVTRLPEGTFILAKRTGAVFWFAHAG